MRSNRAYRATIAIAFVASAAGTIVWCRSMSGGMPMPGGWTMSMAWMRMPGQSWPLAFVSFVAMWLAMMIAMMLPSLFLTLTRYRSALLMRGVTRLSAVTVAASIGYFAVWALLGVLVYPFGVVLATMAMRWPAIARVVPIATGAVILLAGSLQLTRWKARQLNSCRYATDCCDNPAKDARGAWMHGVRSGLRCTLCCAGFTSVLLVAGVMDPGAMAAVAAGITLERFAPRPTLIARATGVVFVAVGTLWIVRSIAGF